MNFNKLLAKYRKLAKSKVRLGKNFERIIQRYLRTEPIYANKFQKIWLWNEFPGQNSISKQDIGIDLVGWTKTGEYWAIQCKCYDENNRIYKEDVDTFISTSGREFEINGQKKRFNHRLFFSTTNKWSKNAEKVIENQHPPVSRIYSSTLEESEVDFIKLEEEKISRDLLSKKRLRPYQKEVIKKGIEHYKKNDRGKLIMACGTGKTYTALKMVEKITNHRGFVLVLVPSISLVNQLMKAWYLDSTELIKGVAVCSDPTAGKLESDEFRSSLVDLPIPATTDAKKIIKEFNVTHTHTHTHTHTQR